MAAAIWTKRFGAAAKARVMRCACGARALVPKRKGTACGACRRHRGRLVQA